MRPLRACSSSLTTLCFRSRPLYLHIYRVCICTSTQQLRALYIRCTASVSHRPCTLGMPELLTAATMADSHVNHRRLHRLVCFVYWTQLCPVLETFAFSWFFLLTSTCCICNLVLKSYSGGILKTTCVSRFSVRLGNLPVVCWAFPACIAVTRDGCFYRWKR